MTHDPTIDWITLRFQPHQLIPTFLALLVYWRGVFAKDAADETLSAEDRISSEDCRKATEILLTHFYQFIK